MPAQKVLITGGCGFLGSNLARRAIEDGRELFIFDNLSRTGSIENLRWLKDQKKEFCFRAADIRDRDAVLAAIRHFRPDAVFHCAGQVAMTSSLENPRLDYETNAIGTFNLIDAVRITGTKPLLVYSSTNKVYGDLETLEIEEQDTRYVLPQHPQGLSESVPLNFRTPYGVSKGSADQMILDANKSFGIPGTVFRHSSMYGARQYATVDQGWIGWFCRQMIELKEWPKHEFTVSGNGKQVRDLLHADDMIALYFGAADHPTAVAGEAFNIGGGPQNALSILELLQSLGDLLEIEPQWQQIAPRGSDQKVFIADISKINARLAWVPRTSWREGITQMVNWSEQLHSSP